MARDIADIILQGAQQITQSIQTAQQLALQQMQFAQNVREADQQLQLKAQNLELQQQNAEYKREQDALKNALEARRVAATEGNLANSEARLAFDKQNQSLQDTYKNLLMENLSARTKKINKELNDAVSGGTPLSDVAARALQKGLPDAAARVVRSEPEKYITGVPPELVQKYAAYDDRMLEQSMSNLADQVEKYGASARFKPQADAAQRKLEELQTLKAARTRAIDDIYTGKNKEGKLKALSLFFPLSPDAMQAAQNLLSTQKVLNSVSENVEPTAVDLSNSLLRPEQLTPEGTARLQAIVAHPPVDVGDGDSVAAELNMLLGDFATGDDFKVAVKHFESLGKQLNEDFDITQYRAALARLAEMRGLRKKESR